MNTHTTASEIQRNASAIRARLMGNGNGTVNLIHAIRAARQAEIDAARIAEEERMAELKRIEDESLFELEARERGRENFLSAIEVMWKAGCSYYEIGAAMNLKPSQVKYLAKRHRDRFPARPGARHIPEQKPKRPEKVTISNLLERNERPVSIIVSEILALYPGITIKDIRGTSRDLDVVAARRHVIYAVRSERPDVSFPVIGRILNRDHTTALHHYNKMKSMMEQRT